MELTATKPTEGFIISQQKLNAFHREWNQAANDFLASKTGRQAHVIGILKLANTNLDFIFMFVGQQQRRSKVVADEI